MAKLLRFSGTSLLPFPELSEEEQPALADAGARASALNIHRSWIVEAPAGSGKTGLLIQRLLTLLAEADIERPNEILAITFTRKAAAELQARVVEQLSSAARDLPLSPNAGAFAHATRTLASRVLRRDRERQWHLLENPHGLNIRTIDSFCAELAASLPLSARLDGQQAPTDDPAPLYRRAAERVLDRLGGSDPQLDNALRCVLLHRDGQIADCIDLIASMLAEREQWAEFLPLHETDWDDALLDGQIRSRLEATLHHVVSRALLDVQQSFDGALLGELTSLSAGWASSSVITRTRPPTADPADLPLWQSLIKLLLTNDGTWRTRIDRRLTDTPLSELDKSRLLALIEAFRTQEQHQPGLSERLHTLRALPPVTYPEAQWQIVKALFHVLRYALAELRQVFSDRGEVDFAEVALSARELLQGDCSSASCLQLTHLLVDEMQDTSAGQYDLLEQLTRHWDGFAQTLFLVGDPKQSIYLFRQARVERFLRTQANGRLGDIPLGTLRLTANFRSQAALVDAFNATFMRILPSPEQLAEHASPGEVPFVAAVATRSAGTQPAAVWHANAARRYTPSQREPDAADDAEPVDEGAMQHARQIRALIEDFQLRWPLRSGTTRPPRIAVLARTRAHLEPVIAEFQRHGTDGPLPFRAIKIERLQDRPEVLDLLALTRALLHPADRVAWLAILRSPVCGLSTSDLLALTGDSAQGDTQATVSRLVETRAHHLSDEGQRLLGRVWPVLATSMATRGQTSFSTQVARTWHSLGAHLFLTPEQRSNASQFFSILQSLEATSFAMDLASIERRLESLYAQSSGQENSVELMTIHNAKGLEWDLVLIPALDGKARRDGNQLLQWLELDPDQDGRSEVILAPIQSKGEDASQLSTWLNQAKGKREAAEAQRLLYVACTRAREELHLFATCRLKKGGELAEPEPTSLLRAAWPAAETEFRRQLFDNTSEGHPSLHLLPRPDPAETFTPALALAASADETGAPIQYESRIARLPWDLPVAIPPVPPTACVRTQPSASTERFQRPEGSFAARAFGNVVHRFLELIATRLARQDSPEALLLELPSWRNRLLTSLRMEGLAPSLSAREADRVLQALDRTLRDPIGRWLLSPHRQSSTEWSVEIDTTAGKVRQLRADRVFLADPDPLTSSGEPHLWIVDFKTTEQGGHSHDGFLAQQRAQYEPQLRSYAQAASVLFGRELPIKLALFYPLIPQTLHWLLEPLSASQ